MGVGFVLFDDVYGAGEAGVEFGQGGAVADGEEAGWGGHGLCPFRGWEKSDGGHLMPAAAAFPRIVAAIFYADGGYMAYAGWAGGSLKTEEWFSGCLLAMGKRGNLDAVGWALVAHAFCVMRQVEPRGHEWPTLRETRQPENGEDGFQAAFGLWG